MSAGYGRGFYGDGQLDKPRKSGSWIKSVAIVGVGGAALWYFWPRIKGAVMGARAGGGVPATVPTIATLPHLPGGLPQLPGVSELELMALARGFSSAKAYEDAVVASARELQATGAQVTLPPQLQHLYPLISG